MDNPAIGHIINVYHLELYGLDAIEANPSRKW